MELCVKRAAPNNEPSARTHYGPLIRGNSNDHQVLPLMSRFLDRVKHVPYLKRNVGVPEMDWNEDVPSSAY
jgi:hypothetical protein